MSVITAGRAGRMLHRQPTIKTLDSESQAGSPGEKQCAVLRHFTAGGRGVFCVCSLSEGELGKPSPGLLQTPPHVSSPLASPAVCPLTAMTHCQDR